MNNNYLDKLEFYKILEKISTYSKTYLGKNLIENLRPSFNENEITNLQLQTIQAINIINSFGNPPVSAFNNTSIHIKKLKSDNILSISEILDLGKILRMSKDLFIFFSETLKTLNFNLNALSSFFNNIYINIELEKEIFTKIIDSSTIDDNASDELYSIRKKKKNLEQNIKNKLNNFIHSSTYSKFLMSPIVTIRDNRYVIPVKDEYKNNINGFVHDISSSGSTVFIEPTIIFDMNNEINTLKIKENIEIEKILYNLTRKLSTHIQEIENNIKLIGIIDFIFAKANYSISIDGISPKINSKKEFILEKAKHPLIDRNTVVPINISLGNTYSTLVITGPNTGGKTVALKTVGLLHIMAYCGLLIPAHENSSIYVFDQIFTDIGDEQSITESLSTFSAHIKNIIYITNNATCKSLILVDELGSGTDPVEGSALAISILEFFHDLGSLCISTTHYSEIKNYALTHNGYLNASAEFDVENLTPTYNIISGIPGKSNAFAISNKLGINNKILKRASSLINSNETKIEDILKSIYDSKKIIEIEKHKIGQNSIEIEKLKLALQKDNLDVHNKELEIIENAKIEARNILLNAKEEATQIIRHLKNINNSNNVLKELNNLRNELNISLKNVSTFTKNIPSNNNIPDTLPIGTKVILNDINQKGVTLSHIKNKKVLVQIGNTKLNTFLSNLSLDLSSSNETEKSYVNTSSISQDKHKHISNEINVIGLTVNEAISIIDKYLDDCYISNLNNIRIVHGKGTGKLRQGIHSYLKKHKQIKNFRLGTFGEGEMGVTIAELKNN